MGNCSPQSSEARLDLAPEREYDFRSLLQKLRSQAFPNSNHEPLSRLYQLYVIDYNRRGGNIDDAVDWKMFFLYFAIFLAEKNLSLATVNERELRQVLAELTSPRGHFDSDIDLGSADVANLIHSTYGTLGAEDELFGTIIAHQVRAGYPRDNRYALTFASDLRDIADKEFCISGRRLFQLLASSVSDCRSFDLLAFFDNLREYQKKDSRPVDADIALSSGSSPPSPGDRTAN